MFITKLWEDPASYVLWVTIVAFSICVHEVAHAWVAATQGDRTAVERGYCTLNPLKVMGPQSLLMLAICGIAWGAVPVSPAAMRRRYSHVLVACAGPAANLALAVLFVIPSAVISMYPRTDLGGLYFALCFAGVQANCVLLILNMLPVPMLDGWQFWSWVLPPLRRLDPEKQAGLTLFALVLVFMSPVGSFVFRGAHAFGTTLLELSRDLTSIVAGT